MTYYLLVPPPYTRCCILYHIISYSSRLVSHCWLMGPVLWPRTTDYLVPGAYLVLLIVTAVHIYIYIPVPINTVVITCNNGVYELYNTYWCQVSGTRYTAEVHTIMQSIKFARAHGVLLILKNVLQAVRTCCVCELVPGSYVV